MSKPGDNVDFGNLVPSALVRRRVACPVAYLPIGVLEWHGVHMPFGTDYLCAQYLARRAAAEIGGVAFPPLCYGDVRYRVHDSRGEWRDEYVREMSLPKELVKSFPMEPTADYTSYTTPAQKDDLTVEDPLPFTRDEQESVYAKLIAMTLVEIFLYGFKTIVLVVGHGPAIRACRCAEQLYAQNAMRRKSLQPPARTVTFVYWEECARTDPLLGKHWVHADLWECSCAMKAAPGTVRLDLLPKDPFVIPSAYLGCPYLHPERGYSDNHKDLWENFDAMDPRSGCTETYGEVSFSRAVASLKDALALREIEVPSSEETA